MKIVLIKKNKNKKILEKMLAKKIVNQNYLKKIYMMINNNPKQFE